MNRVQIRRGAEGGVPAQLSIRLVLSSENLRIVLEIFTAIIIVIITINIRKFHYLAPLSLKLTMSPGWP